MNVAEQLSRALESLRDRVRDDLNRHLESIKAELDAALGAAVDEARREAAADTERRLREEGAEQVRQLEARINEQAEQARMQASQDADHVRAQAAQETEQAVARAVEEARQAAVHAAEQAAAQAVEQAQQAAAHAAEQAAAQAVEQAQAHYTEREAGLVARHHAELERLVEAIRTIDHARSLTETLDSLIACASRESARSAVFMVRDGSLRRLRSIGFGPAIDDAHDFTLTNEDAGIVGDAMRAGVLTPLAPGRSGPAFAALAPDAVAVAAPLVIGSRVMAVLYGDQSDQGVSDRSHAETLERRFELLARHAARSLEALTALQTAARARAASRPVPVSIDEALAAKGGRA